MTGIYFYNYKNVGSDKRFSTSFYLIAQRFNLTFQLMWKSGLKKSVDKEGIR